MIRKIFKIVLVAIMVFGAVIAITNIFDSNLHSGEMKVVTYYPDIPNCKGPAKDCNDFTGSSTND